VPFLRARESSFLDAVRTSARSSVGIYDIERVKRATCGSPEACADREALEDGL
jgi:hypothetical protein